MIRDRIVIRITDSNTRKLLFQRRNLKLEEALDICKGVEANGVEAKGVEAKGVEATQHQLASMCTSPRNIHTRQRFTLKMTKEKICLL